MENVIHRANDRGIQDHGWLKAAHSFSFGSFHDPSKINFGLLRVLNDDIIAPVKALEFTDMITWKSSPSRSEDHSPIKIAWAPLVISVPERYK